MSPINKKTGQKIKPDLNQEATKIINLKVLQRIDPSIEEILITAGHVTFYKFNIDKNEWSRRDVEGSLFVVKRTSQPRFQFVVMNRKNTDNLVEDLLGEFEYEMTIPYLLYKNAAQEVNGIWFYNSSDCEAVEDLFSRILRAYSKVPPKLKVSSTKSDFEESETVRKNVMEVLLESPSSNSTAPNIANAPEDSSFLKFFNTATSITNASNAANPGQYQPPAVIPPSFRSPNVPTTVPALEIPYAPSPRSGPSLPFPNFSETHVTNLVKPSVFLMQPPLSTYMIPSTSSSTPTVPPLQSPVSLQQPYGAPLLQAFPPPTPPPSLTPTTPINGLGITRDKVRGTLMRLVQNNRFVDMFYEELLKGTG